MRMYPKVIAALLPIAALGQNLPPSVSIVNVAVDAGAGTVTIAYDLFDPENDACSVTLRASFDGGLHYALDALSVSGDVGAGVAPGGTRTMVWNYGAIPNIYEARVMVVADDGNAPDIQTMVDQVDTQRLMERMTNLAVPRHHSAHPAGLSAVRDSLITAYELAGLKLSLHDAVYQGDTAPNVLGRHSGLYDDSRTYIVDAHYDAVSNTPGADDNASGVVATLEIARILGQYRFRHSLRFIGFAFEEQGLVGSGQYVQTGIPVWEQIAGVLNMEMIGYYSDAPNSQSVPAGFDLLFPNAVAEIAADSYRGNFLTVVGNTNSSPLIDTYLSACDTYVPGLRRIPLAVPGNGQIAPDLRRSDHARFWDAGIMALMLTDGADTRNMNYHTPADAVDIIDPEFFTNNVKATLAAAALLAEPINAGSDSYGLDALAGMDEHFHGFPCTAELFPNPTSDLFTVRLGDCEGLHITGRLFDLKGVQVGGRDLRISAPGTRHTFSVAGLAEGTYLLVLETGGSSTTLRVEVER